jgi:hypothetical protein
MRRSVVSASMLGVALSVAVAAGGAGGCRARGAPPRHGPTTVPAHAEAEPTARTRVFHDPASGFSLRYPADWSLRHDPRNVFTAVARANDPNSPELDVAVPKLPPHIPGLIPLGSVQSGYVDDLKKRLGDVRVEQVEDPPPISGAKSRRFDATGRDATGNRWKLSVLLLLRGDRLYILTAAAPAAEFDQARAAFDRAVASWQWTQD